MLAAPPTAESAAALVRNSRPTPSFLGQSLSAQGLSTAFFFFFFLLPLQWNLNNSRIGILHTSGETPAVRGAAGAKRVREERVSVFAEDTVLTAWVREAR